MTDLFADFVPDEWIDNLFAVMCEAPWHRYQVLTKRASRMRQYMTTPGREARVRRAAEALAARDVIRLLDDPVQAWPLPHVIMMVSAETQREANERIPDLLATPAACRGVSLEPLLGDIRLRSWLQRSPSAAFSAGRVTADMPEWTRIGSTAIDWVIAGGESGPHARPAHPDWFRSLRDQCAAAGVPFHFKQWGEFMPPESAATSYAAKDWRDVLDATGTTRRVAFVGDRVLDSSRLVVRVGKKAAGRLLDGIEHNGFPT